MMMQEFDIQLGKFRVPVQQIYSSAQVSRYEVRLKGKFFVLECRHLNKSAKWKIVKYSEDVVLEKLMGWMGSIEAQIEEREDIL